MTVVGVRVEGTGTKYILNGMEKCILKWTSFWTQLVLGYVSKMYTQKENNSFMGQILNNRWQQTTK